MAGYFALPSVTSQDAVYQAVGILSVVCILVGVRLHRPTDRAELVPAGRRGACFTLGDGHARTLQRWSSTCRCRSPRSADAFYLAGYLFVFAGILRLTRSPDHSGRREDYADAAIMAIGALAFSWHFLMNAYVHDPSLTGLGKLVDPGLSDHGHRPGLHRVSGAAVRPSRAGRSTKLLAAALIVLCPGRLHLRPAGPPQQLRHRRRGRWAVPAHLSS